ncbi:hypothetical protein ABT403_34805 [Streptomyces sp. NPDC000075]
MIENEDTGDWIAADWGTPGWGTQGFAVTAALQGLIGGSGMWYRDALRAIERTGRYVAGTWEPADGEDGPRPAGEGSWTGFIGQTGLLALRAAVPSTRPPRREVLLNLLEMWAESPFADPAFRFRTGVLAEADVPWGVRDAHGGAAVATYWPIDGTRRFLQAWTGETAPPRLGEGEVQSQADTPRGHWGTAGQLRRLVALVRERGPIPWDPAAVEDLSRATGMSRGAAALTLSGNPGSGGYYVPFLENEERAVLDLKTAEAEDARCELIPLHDQDRLTLLSNVLPEDPADLWEPGGLRRVASRTAQAWLAQRGGRIPAPRRTREAAMALETARYPSADVCSLFLQPASAPLPGGADLLVWPRPARDTRLFTAWDVMTRHDTDRLLDTIFTALPWAYADLPAGDPVRDGAPELVRVLREVSVPRDSPSRMLSGELGRAHAGVIRGDWLNGAACKRMMARIADGALPEGRYESDPGACVPELVAQVGDRLRLAPDPAVLYLQLLALLSPTDRNVRRWNGWTPARHKKAVAALLELGLVVEDKRPRAGRGVFLPGPWVQAAKPLLPVERWKADLHGLVLRGEGTELAGVPLPPRTLPELFAAAWQRVEDKEGPSL